MMYSDNPFTEKLHKHPHEECTRCVMNTSDPLIEFDDDGVCNYCHSYDAHLARIGGPDARKRTLSDLVDRLKRNGHRKNYDCIMGLSGGVDSSYLVWFAVRELGLRPLVVHVDAGWNSELAVNNIQNTVQKLNLDLHTLVVDWKEIRDLQRSYFLSGLANLDVPQDHAFIASLYKEARKYGIRDILSGGNMQTECTLPAAWGYDASDGVSLRSIHKKFGQKKLDTYPQMSNWHRYVYFPYVLRLKVHRPLEYIEYSKDAAKDILINELGWRDYGGKHFESVFTKFFQAHYLPTKFGYDKRLAHLSSLVTSGQMTRIQAKEELTKPIYDPQELEQDIVYWVKKLGLTMDEYNRIMNEEPADYSDYPNSEKLHKRLKTLKNLAGKVYRSVYQRKL